MLVDVRPGRLMKRLIGHGWDVRCVDWHPHQGLIASGSKDMLVKFWDPRSGKDLSTLSVYLIAICFLGKLYSYMSSLTGAITKR